MQLDQHSIAEFKELYLREYGIALADHEAVEYGTRLIMFVKAIYGKNVPKVEIEKKREK